MKGLNFTLLTVTAITLISCGGVSNEPANADGFSAIEKELKGEFGDDAYYTDLSISYDASIGNMVGTTVTDDPESLKMGEWTFSQGAWNQTSEITLEVPEGSEAADFMFQLGDEINLTKLGELVEESMKELTAKKDIENPSLSMAFVKFPDDGDMEKVEYVVMLEPETGGTSYSFYYNLKGELREMDY